MHPSQSFPEILIQPKASAWKLINLKEIIRYRELIYFLSLRDIQVKYKQAAFGIAWVIAQPLFMMLSYTFLFGKVARMDSEGLPYAAFSFSALVPWSFFVGAIQKGSLSLVGSGSLFSKVYFPRLVIPIAAVVAGLLDYVISLICLFIILVFFNFTPQVSWLVGLPLVTLWIFVLATGISFWLGALNVKYRDVGHILPFLVQVWMFLTPIVYPIGVIPERFQVWIKLNPMVGIIDTYRSLLFGRALDPLAIALSLLISLVLFASGAAYFARTERSFADIV